MRHFSAAGAPGAAKVGAHLPVTGLNELESDACSHWHCLCTFYPARSDLHHM